MPQQFVPSEAELVKACTEVKARHPEFGVKRVYEAIRARHADWSLTSRRVQKVMRAKSLTIQPPEQPKFRQVTCFPEDCVTLTKRPSQVGWVTRAAGVLGGSDDDEFSDDEDAQLSDGTARVQWLDRYEPSVENVEDLTCADRPYAAGDVVARAESPNSGVLGTVLSVACKVDVKVLFVPHAGEKTRRGSRRDNTSSSQQQQPPQQASSSSSAATSHLQQLKVRSVLRDLDAAEGVAPAGVVRLGDAVSHAQCARWVGRVVSASYDVTVRPNGRGLPSVVFKGLLGSAEDNTTVEPVEDSDLGFDELCPYFPGQKLSASPNAWRRAARGSSSSSSRSAVGFGRRRRSGVVEKVELAGVRVQWLGYGAGARAEAPPAWCDAKDVVLMSRFQGAARVGDHVVGKGHHGKLPAEACGQVIRTKTTCVVAWNDGSADETVASVRLVPRQQLGDHDFLPNDFVVRAHDDDEEDDDTTGVVTRVDGKERTVSVAWMEGDAVTDKRETLSAYELALHSDYNVSSGEIVLRLQPGVGLAAAPFPTEDETAENISPAEARDIAAAIRMSLADAGVGATTTGTSVRTDDGGHRNWLGQVGNLVDGRVEVLWLDGSKERVHPRLLLSIPGTGSEYDDDEDYDDDDLDDASDVDSDDAEEEDADQAPQAAAPTPNPPQGLLATIATTVLGRVGSSSSNNNNTNTTPDDDAAVHDDDDDAAAAAMEEEPEPTAQEAVEDGGAAAFAVVDCEPPEDHHYKSTQPQRVPLKVTRKLWNQLNKNLPAGVAVRAFEKRTDLLRAVILGPKDTPYAELLFVFDFQLTADYPNEPPDVYYHARGVKERLNPNLYENGKVCLSLLGTWSGPGWDPGTSTLLQVLVSIQGLVLVDRPYYNEPGNEKHCGTAEGDQQVHTYNESATLLAIKTTVSVLKQPPVPLASFIAAHVQSEAFQRLVAKLGGQLSSSSSSSSEPEAAASPSSEGASSSHPPSEGYKRVLKRLLPQLTTAVDRFLASRPVPLVD